jgi:hypothetical protein
MTNGEIAVVMEVNEQIKLRPKVIIIIDEEKNPVSERMIDLSKMATDKHGNTYAIRNVIRPEDWHVDINKYYHQGLIQKGFGMK